MKTTKQWLSLLLSLIMVLSVIAVVPIDAFAASGSIRMKHYMTCSMKQHDYSAFTEPWGYNAGCCAVSYAVGLSIVTGESINPTQFWYGGTTHYTKGKLGAYISCNSNNYASTLYESLYKGYPVMLHYKYGNHSDSEQHWVIVIGATNNSLSASSFICIDPVSGTEKTLNNCWRFDTVYGMRIFSETAKSIEKGEHTTHSYDTYVYYWDAHPHYKCYQCSCGDVKENRDEKVIFDTCDACLADYKATLTTDRSKFGIGESVTIKWNEIPGATHYNLWLYKRNDDGTSTRVSRDDKIKGTRITYNNLAEGKYYTYFATYNSNVWKQDHSDWFYSIADSIEFEVTNKILPSKPTLTVRPGTSEDYTQFTWRATNYTDSYTLHIFDIDNNEKLPLFTDITRLTYHVKLPAGNYRAHIASINDNLKDTSLWYTVSDSITFTVMEGKFAPVNVIEINGKKYELYDNSMTWDKAKSKCEELGGHLVTITSQEEIDIIKKLITSGNRYGYWTGLADIDKNKIWENITGEVSNYSYWAENQPDYFEDNEDCAIIQNEKDYRWNDVPHDCASYHIGFICEYEVEEPKILLGDANEDDKVSIQDATAIQKHIASIITLSEDGCTLADVDASDDINIKDATAIQKYIAGIETGFPIG